MTNTYKEERNRNKLLARLKKDGTNNYTSSSLVQSTDGNGIFSWMSSAGQGALSLDALTEQERRSVDTLIQQGRLVPTFAHDFFLSGEKLRLMQHFDDVRFGVDSNEHFVIYDLVVNLPTIPDDIIRTDETHDAAITLLKARLNHAPHIQKTAMIDPDPICLRPDGELVYPILTDSGAIETRQRQHAFRNTPLSPA